MISTNELILTGEPHLKKWQKKKAYKIQASVQYAKHQLRFQSHVGAFQKSSKIGHQ